MKFVSVKTSVFALVLACGAANLAAASENNPLLDDLASVQGSYQPKINFSADLPLPGAQGNQQRPTTTFSCESALPTNTWLQILEENVLHGTDIKTKTQGMAGIYKILNDKSSFNNQIAAGNTVLDILKKTSTVSKNCQLQQPSSSQKATPLSLTGAVDINSCQIAQFLQRLSCASKQISRDGFLFGSVNPNSFSLPNNFGGSYGSGSDSNINSLEFLLFLLGVGLGGGDKGSPLLGGLENALEVAHKSGLNIAFKGEGTLKIMYDPCGNACPNVCGTDLCHPWSASWTETKPGCNTNSCAKDRGAIEAVGRLIEAFQGKIDDSRVQTLLNSAASYGTDTQQQQIYALLGKAFGSH